MAETYKNTNKQKCNSASSQNLNTSRVQNLVPTTITSTIMWSSPAPKREETQ